MLHFYYINLAVVWFHLGWAIMALQLACFQHAQHTSSRVIWLVCVLGFPLGWLILLFYCIYFQQTWNKQNFWSIFLPKNNIIKQIFTTVIANMWQDNFLIHLHSLWILVIPYPFLPQPMHLHNSRFLSILTIIREDEFCWWSMYINEHTMLIFPSLGCQGIP